MRLELLIHCLPFPWRLSPLDAQQKQSRPGDGNYDACCLGSFHGIVCAVAGGTFDAHARYADRRAVARDHDADEYRGNAANDLQLVTGQRGSPLPLPRHA